MTYSKHEKTEADWDEIEKAFLLGRAINNQPINPIVRLSKSEIIAKILVYKERRDRQLKALRVTRKRGYIVKSILRYEYYINHYSGLLDEI